MNLWDSDKEPKGRESRSLRNVCNLKLVLLVRSGEPYTTANSKRADTIARAFVHASPCNCVCKASRRGPAAEDLEMRLLHVCMPACVYE